MPNLIVVSGDGERKQVSLAPGETVLDGLLDAGVEVSYGCKSGVCHSCLLQTPDQDAIPYEAQQGLRSVERGQGYFLSCKCKPEKPLRIQLEGVQQRYQSKVVGLDKVADSIWRLRLTKSLAYRPGQYLTLKHSSGVIRSYSIASHPIHDDFIECHIRTFPNGKFSHIVKSELKVGDSLELLGPYGRCVYEKTESSRVLFMGGMGTGLAPLYGIARDALMQGHKGQIIMLIGASQSNNLYHQSELAKLSRAHPNLKIEYSIQQLDNTTAILPISDIYEKAAKLLPNMTGCGAYLCGNQSFVQRLRKECFLRGASLSDIKSDEFLRAVA